MNAETIDHTTLSALVEAGAIRSATAVGQGNHWTLVVHYGSADKTLQAKNSRQVRTWTKLDSLVKYLRKLGIRKFDTDATNYDPEQQSTQKRPDKAEALKKAHQAAKHDAWFCDQVQQGIEEAARGVLVSHDEAVKLMEKMLAERIGPRH
ncbi:MAG: hypothetical protein AB2669_19630 [Candidatus Thiodiazotropha endolucinida]